MFQLTMDDKEKNTRRKFISLLNSVLNYNRRSSIVRLKQRNGANERENMFLHVRRLNSENVLVPWTLPGCIPETRLNK